MASVSAVLETQKSLEAMLLKKMDDFQDQLRSSSPRKDKSDKVAQLQSEFSTFRDYVCDILRMLRQQISEVLRSVDDIEMRHRQKYLLISGVTDKANEDLPVTISSILHRHFGLTDLSAGSLKKYYRLGTFSEGRTRPIAVCFSDYKVRSSIWKNKTKLKGTSVVVHEFLTKPRQALFHAARKHFGISNAWTSEGNIFVKTPDGSRQRISTHDELMFATTKFPAANQPSDVAAERVTPGVSVKPAPSRSKRTIRTIK